MNGQNQDRSKGGKQKAGVTASLIFSLGFAGLGFAGSFLSVPSALAQAARTDADIQTDVAAAIGRTPQLQGQQITAATIMGDVTLSGTVQSDSAKQMAQQVAAGVSGVRSVFNNLTVGNLPAQTQTADQNGEQAPPPPPYDQGVSQPDEADNQGGYPQQQSQQGYGYPQQQQSQGYGYPQQQQNYPGQPNTYYPQQQTYQQPASGPVTVPAGTLLNVRTSEPLDARKTQVGTMFEATVASDVFQGNVLAIPRGAVLHGQVTGVKKAGDLAGKNGLQLQVTSLSLGGQTYALTTDAWTGEGPGKGGYSAGNTAGGAALGAIIGAIAGGGPGAAIGAVAGGATGVAASAATKGPQVVVPPESLISFHLAAPVTVTPPSTQEIQQLAASAPQQPQLRRRPVYYAPYGYYPYGYPYYYRPGYYYYYPRY
jgi:hypothetical protein